MVRQSRIDFPGALHHVIARGMERKKLFRDDTDRRRFLKTLAKVMEKTGTSCLAYALMTNHIHLQIITGTTPLSTVMQKLLTSYAVYFNLRHNRTGKLYQNRFKSVLCDKEEYLLQLARYIHLNPVKAGIVETMRKLDSYRWTSHSVYMGKQNNDGIDTEEILSHFGRTEQTARKEYRAFIAAGIDIEEPVDFEGGGLIRSLGGYWETLKKAAGGKQNREAADERILGSGTFVEKTLKAADEKEGRQSRLKRGGYTLKKVEKKVCDLFGITPKELQSRGIRNSVSKGRALFSIWMHEELGMAKSELAEYLRVSRPAMTKLVKRGEEVKEGLGKKGNLVN